MTTPTLELHISATGLDQVAALRAELAALNAQANELRNIGQSVTALDRLAQEMKDMRTEVVAVMKDVKAALVDGLKGTFQQAVQNVNSGANDLTKAFNEKMQAIANSINKANEDAAKRLLEVNGATVTQAKAAGERVGKAFAEGEQEASAKIRLSYSAGASGGVRASASVNGTDFSKIEQAKAEIASLAEVQAATAAAAEAAAAKADQLQAESSFKIMSRVAKVLAAKNEAEEAALAAAIAAAEKSDAAQAEFAFKTMSRVTKLLEARQAAAAETAAAEAAAAEKAAAAQEAYAYKVMSSITKLLEARRAAKAQELVDQEAANAKMVAQEVAFQTNIARANKLPFSSIQPGSYGSSYNLPKPAEAEAAAKSIKRVGEEANATSSMMDHLSLSNARVRREFGTMVSEGLENRWANMRNSFLALLNAMGLFAPIFSTGGLAIAAVVAGVIALGVAAVKGEEEVTAFNNAMTLTNGYVGLTRGQMDEMAHTISDKLTVSIGTSKEALLAMAKTGRITGDELKVLTEDVILQANLTGESLESVVKEYAKMPEGVYKWAQQHNESMHFMSSAQLEHVRLLELQGQKQQAMLEVGGALNEQFKKQAENLGWLEKAARLAKNALSDMWDGLLGVGREKSIDDKIKELEARIGNTPKVKAGDMDSVAKAELYTQSLSTWQAQLEALRSDKALIEQAAQTKAYGEQLQVAAESGQKVLEQFGIQADKAAKLDEALVKVRASIKAINDAWLSDPTHTMATPYSLLTKQGFINDAQAKELVRKTTDFINGGSRGNDGGLQSSKQEFKDLEALTKSEFANLQGLRDDDHRKGLLDDAAYFNQSIAAEKANSDLMIEALVDEYDKRAALIEKKSAAINASTTMKAGAKADQIKALWAGLDTWHDSMLDKIVENSDKANTALQKAADNSLGATLQFVHADQTYWAKAEGNSRKAADQARIKRDLAGATEEERVQAEAIAKVQDSQAVRLGNLQEAYDLAWNSLQQFAGTLSDSESMTETQKTVYTDWAQKVKLLGDELAKARGEVSKLSDEAANTALDDLADKRLQQMRNSAKQLSDQLDKGIVDAAFTRGKSSVQKLRNEIENAFLSPIKVVLQALIQPITNGLVNMGYSMLGMNNATPNGGSGLFGMASSGLGIYNGANSLMSGGGMLASMGSLQSGSAGILGAAGSALGIGASSAGVGAAAPAVFNAAMDSQAANVALGISSTAGGAGAAGALAAVPVAGWIAAAAVIGMALFGGDKHGPKQGAYYGADTLNPHGGAGSEENTPAAIEQMKQAVTSLQSTYDSYVTAMGGLAGGAKFGMGVETDPKGTAASAVEATTRSASGEIIFSQGNANVGRSDAELQAAIALQGQRAILAGLQSAGLSSKVTDYLKQLDPYKATADQITKYLSVAQIVGQLDKALIALGPDFRKVTNLSVDSESALVGMAGGLDKFSASLTSYYQNFYTDSERQSATWAHLRGEFQAINKDMPTTRDGFKALVNSVDVTSEAGQKLYATLINMSSEFASVTQATKDTTLSVTDATSQLTEAYNAEKDALTQAHDKFAGFVTAFKDFMKQLTTGDLAGLTPQQKYDATKSQFQTDLSNLNSTDPAAQEAALGALQQDSQDFLAASRDFYGASQGYYDDLNAVKAAVQFGQEVAQQQADIATQQLAALDQMVSGLITINQTIVGSMGAVVAAIQNLQAAQTATLDASASMTQPATTSAATSSSSSSSVTAAATAPPSLRSIFGNPSLSSGSAVVSYDNSGNAPYDNGYGGGAFATGLDRVPVDGFRATLHQDEMVLNREAASDYRGNRSGISNSLLRTLVTRMQSLESTMGQGLAGVIGATHSAADRNGDKVVKGTMDAHQQTVWNQRTKDKAAIR